MSDIITLDYETFFSDTFTLKKLTTLEYVAHEEFKIHGVGIKINEQPTEWVSDMEIAHKEIAKMSNNALLAHNAMFDGLIMQYHYGILFDFYYDTMAMSAGFNPHGSARLEALCELLWPDDESMRKGEELMAIKGIRDLDEEQEKAIAGYCIQDVELTHAAFQKMNWFPKEELKVIDLTCRMYIHPVLRLDSDMTREHMEQVTAERDAAVAATPHDKSLFSSNPKFANLLIDTYDIDPPTKISKTTNKKTWAFGTKDLDFIRLRADHPELDNIWQARVKVKSTQEISRSKRLLTAASIDSGWMRVPLDGCVCL